MKRSIALHLLTLAVLVAFLLFEQTSFAQVSKVSFSGKWAYNESKSTTGGGGGGGFRRGGGEMTITQEGNNLTVARTRSTQSGESMTTTEKYTLDGKESVNTPAAGRGGASKSTVKWSTDGRSLNFVTVRTFERDGQSTEMKTTETWTLTDANTLSVVSAFNTPNGEMKSTLVYDKK